VIFSSAGHALGEVLRLTHKFRVTQIDFYAHKALQMPQGRARMRTLGFVSFFSAVQETTGPKLVYIEQESAWHNTLPTSGIDALSSRLCPMIFTLLNRRYWSNAPLSRSFCKEQGDARNMPVLLSSRRTQVSVTVRCGSEGCKLLSLKSRDLGDVCKIIRSGTGGYLHSAGMLSEAGCYVGVGFLRRLPSPLLGNTGAHWKLSKTLLMISNLR
jgi:hypothetical protein